ncbi:MAG: homoserine dehydrogenase [Candidatus Nitronauta litoralis]|uniref:Homoserine dehydrogenase n=1 Tax=Candidatus Nitronauta litoralis TaxID=2705533 RepID=A0A7T0G1G0_9BACT|nr:MAG: homoserine dehydrogenase [Candidatus Nitronauta litoralis]
MDSIKLGIIGFGTIGSSVVKILQQNGDQISQRLGANLELVKVADLDITTDRGVALPPGTLTTQAEEVFDSPDIDIVIELMGGYEPARTFVLKAMENGKHVVTANKALLALHGDELFGAAEKSGVALLFEAAVGGAIPIIRSIKESFVANKIQAIEGIVNGTANYILTKMSDEGLPFDQVLKEAQAKGFAEADPTFDIEGIDSAHKIAVLTRLAYGTSVKFDSIYTQGISSIRQEDIECASQFGYRIKLLAISKYDGKSIDVRVHPAMVPQGKPIANVNGVLNAVLVCDDCMEENILVGHGAGGLPTGSAVIGDVVDIARDVIAGCKGRVPPQSYPMGSLKEIPLKNINEIEGEYFLRFVVKDQPGVLSKISGILGQHEISIRTMIQRERCIEGSGVPLVLMTHQALENNVQNALKEIDVLDIVSEKTVLIRVEE